MRKQKRVTNLNFDMSGRIWTKTEDEFLFANYANKSSAEIAKVVGHSENAVYNRAFLFHLKKSEKYRTETNKRLAAKLAEKGKAHRFPKGQTPFNKGQKMPEQVYAKVERTMFRKGHIPANHRQVGSERINVDGYTEIKVADPNKFVLKHRLIWEQANGPIPKGYNVQFKDGNRQNITLDNLYLISRSSQMKHENSYHARYPEEVRKSIQLMGALQRQINKRKKS